MTDAQGRDLAGAWQDAIASAERALGGNGASRTQVETAVEELCEDRQLPDQPSVGQDITYLVSLLESLGLYDMSRALLEHVASCFGQNPGALQTDAAARNQLAVTFAERGHLTVAEMLLTRSAEGGLWTAATLANQACVMLRRNDLDGAADAATRARQAAVPAQGDDETEEQLDVQVLATAVLAEVTRQGGSHAEADQWVAELEGFVRRLVGTLGGDHPKSLSALVTLASAEYQSARAAGEHERMEQAVDVIAIAAQRMSATLGTDHPRSLSALQNLATVDYETALGLGDGRRLQGARALMTAAAERADALSQGTPWQGRGARQATGREASRRAAPRAAVDAARAEDGARKKPGRGRRVILWRHGQTSWNVERRFQGTTDVDLTETGVGQARRAARLLASLKPDAIVASDLQCAANTAGELASLTGLTVTHDEGLRETYAGAWQGLTHEEIISRYGDGYAAWKRGEPVRRGGGELETEVAGRAAPVVLRHVEKLPDNGTLVVVSHGGTIRTTIGRLLGLAPHHWESLGGLSNCCWSVLGEGARGWRLLGYNAGTLPEPVLGDDD